MSNELTRDDFQKAVNSSFTLLDGERTIGMLELVEVLGSNYPTSPGMEHAGRPFSAIFLGRHTNMAPQGTYLTDSVLGRRELFLVPISKTPDGYTYEAVFN